MHTIHVGKGFAATLCDWAHERGFKALNSEDRALRLSNTGFAAVGSAGVPVACAFLYPSDGSAFVNDFWSDPTASHEERALGLELAFKACINLARQMRIPEVLAWTPRQRTVDKLLNDPQLGKFTGVLSAPEHGLSIDLQAMKGPL